MKDEDGNEVEMTCMECGVPITELKEAPSGTMIPRCNDCNDKRWKQFSNSLTEQQGAVSRGVHLMDDDPQDPIDDEW
jgi:DNA-directed RNA polymerase subunit RPC12/RpoP